MASPLGSAFTTSLRRSSASTMPNFHFLPSRVISVPRLVSHSWKPGVVSSGPVAHWWSHSERNRWRMMSLSSLYSSRANFSISAGAEMPASSCANLSNPANTASIIASCFSSPEGSRIIAREWNALSRSSGAAERVNDVIFFSAGGSAGGSTFACVNSACRPSAADPITPNAAIAGSWMKSPCASIRLSKMPMAFAVSASPWNAVCLTMLATQGARLGYRKGSFLQVSALSSSTMCAK
mmetsp:Transcript_39540/g.99677  ORF Transcript_39540/g.99677 Transcript_39540/m.99677 type:complete len:238 (+) Transcript_39540:181-894(+)